MRKIIRFFNEVRTELGKVSWPTPKQTINLTIVVVIVSIVISLYVGGIDLLLAKIGSKFLK